jgi:hypothetical protein
MQDEMGDTAETTSSGAEAEAEEGRTEMPRTAETQPPQCPECGGWWVRSSHRFALTGKLSHLNFDEAAKEYYRHPDRYDDTSVHEFECGHIATQAAVEEAGTGAGRDE